MAMTVAVAIGGFTLVTVLRRSLIDNIDQLAEIRAADVAQLVGHGAFDATIAVDDDEAVQVLDAAGRVLAASASLRDQPALGPPAPGLDLVATRTVDHLAGLKGPVRVLVTRTSSGSGPVTVYVATSLVSADATVVRVRTSLWIGAPSLVVLVAVLTWLATVRALAPVEAIRRDVDAISHSDLARRVTVPGTRDEIGRLALTMNTMLARLEAASARQQRFVADASHELQSPLAANRIDLEVALAHPTITDWVATGRDVLAENDRMERLITDLLYLARADSHTPRPPSTPVDLHDIIHDQVARTRTTTTVAIDTTAVHPTVVHGRRDDLARLVRNLLDNAVRHARHRVTITLAAPDGVTVLIIDDDGPGIPTAARERVFERFTRLDPARPHDQGGTGLGLAIAHEIVTAHDGTITIDDAAGGGARFVVVLPPAPVSTDRTSQPAGG